VQADLLIKNGHVIDPKNGVDGVADIAIEKGRIAAVGSDIQANAETVDASGRIVMPGIIDMHTHIYWGATSLGIKPDELARKSGTTTWLDVGSAGPGNFEGFREFIAKSSETRVFALLHISFAGIYAFSRDVMVGESGDLRLLDPMACAKVAMANTDLIRGIKVRIGAKASGYNGTLPLDLALEAADIAQMPLMCHIDMPPPTIEEVLDKLRPGDVLTHAFRPQPNSPLNGAGQIKDAVLRARERGVLFDIGHGQGSFGFDTAERMLELGFEPDVISSDVHALCIDGPAFDNLETMNKFFCMGMPLANIVKSVTETPAKFIGEDDLGHFSTGAAADISILEVVEEPYTMTDVRGVTRTASKRLALSSMVLDGKVWG
jgi:dihydroorotase